MNREVLYTVQVFAVKLVKIKYKIQSLCVTSYVSRVKSHMLFIVNISLITGLETFLFILSQCEELLF